MRISRAIGRVRRHAKQGILGLGEGLQSSVVPRPLRGAARRLAELLGASKTTTRARKEPARVHTSPATSVVYPPQVVVTDTPDQVTLTGTDSGVEPNVEPRDDTPVDPALVGAIPTYDATPIEVAPVEVTAVDATPLEVTSIEVAPAVLENAEPLEGAQAIPIADVSDTTQPLATVSPANPATSDGKQPVRSGGPARNGKKRPASAAADATAKEKVAPSEEAAKTLARSGSRGAKKRSGPRADTSSKKK